MAEDTGIGMLLKMAAAQRAGLDPTAAMFADGQGQQQQAAPLDPSASQFGGQPAGEAVVEDTANVEKAQEAAQIAGLDAQKLEAELAHDKAIAEADLTAKQAEIAKAQALAAKAEIASQYARPTRKKAKPEQQAAQEAEVGQPQETPMEGTQKAARIESFKTLVGHMKNAGWFGNMVAGGRAKVAPLIAKGQAKVSPAIEKARLAVAEKIAPKDHVVGRQMTQADIDAMLAADRIRKGLATKGGASSPAVTRRDVKLLNQVLLGQPAPQAAKAAVSSTAPAASGAKPQAPASKAPAPQVPGKVGVVGKIVGGDKNVKQLANELLARNKAENIQEATTMAESIVSKYRRNAAIAGGTAALGAGSAAAHAVGGSDQKPDQPFGELKD